MPVYIWLYCIGWWFVQDAAKVRTHTNNIKSIYLLYILHLQLYTYTYNHTIYSHITYNISLYRTHITILTLYSLYFTLYYTLYLLHTLLHTIPTTHYNLTTYTTTQVYTFYLLKKHNYFGYNDTGKVNICVFY
jgi:hypothetical protein